MGTPRWRTRGARLEGSSLNTIGQERKDRKKFSSCSGMPKKRRIVMMVSKGREGPNHSRSVRTTVHEPRSVSLTRMSAFRM